MTYTLIDRPTTGPATRTLKAACRRAQVVYTAAPVPFDCNRHLIALGHDGTRTDAQVRKLVTA